MERKTFAFQLADKRRSDGKWKAREGVSAAGCTTPVPLGILRYNVGLGRDNGEYC